MRFDECMSALAELREPVTGRTDARSRPSAVGAWLEREALTISVASLYAIILLLAMPGELVQDSWSTLVGGREIARGGLPHHEALTVMAHGARWVDQQWLAQLAFYDLFRVGGYRAILLVHVALITAAFAIALLAARRRGGSPLAVFAVAVICLFVAPWGWQLRAQSFAPLLFVAVLWLLVADGRTRSRNVFFVVPLLVVWANLHGSVVLGALLTALYGALLVLDPRRRDLGSGAVLIAAAPLAVVASPYGFALVGYYRNLLVDPPFGRLVNEWTAPAPGALTALFYLLAFLTVWALGRRSSTLTLFERLALLATLASALHATRNVIWFELTALVLLPVLLTGAQATTQDGAAKRLRTGVAVAMLGVVAGALAFTATRPASWSQSLWPTDRGVAAVSLATRDPQTRVFASDRDADWLLWRLPQLRGRVAFDVRFELNTRQQIRRLQRFFEQVGPRWQAVARGYDVIVLNRKHHDRVRRALLERTGLRQAYLDDDMALLVRANRRRR
jgi:hypothetical protein